MIEQWGIDVLTALEQTVTYSVTYTQPPIVSLTLQFNGVLGKVVHLMTVGTSNFTWKQETFSPTSDSNAVYWCAIGH